MHEKYDTEEKTAACDGKDTVFSDTVRKKDTEHREKNVDFSQTGQPGPSSQEKQIGHDTGRSRNAAAFRAAERKNPLYNPADT